MAQPTHTVSHTHTHKLSVSRTLPHFCSSHSRNENSPVRDYLNILCGEFTRGSGSGHSFKNSNQTGFHF
jgi:hypothetical protein